MCGKIDYCDYCVSIIHKISSRIGGLKMFIPFYKKRIRFYLFKNSVCSVADTNIRKERDRVQTSSLLW